MKEFEEYRQKIELEKQEQDALFNHFSNNYPDLFTELERIQFYIPVGWTRLLDGVLSKINTPLLQVKQKFGKLRIYTRGQENILAMAEELSGQLCEKCGTMKKTALWEVGFVQTLCKEHSLEQAKEAIDYWMKYGKSVELQGELLYCLQVIRNYYEE